MAKPRGKAIALETLDGRRYTATVHAKGPQEWLAMMDAYRRDEKHATRDGRPLPLEESWVEVNDGLRFIRFDRVVAVSEAGAEEH